MASPYQLGEQLPISLDVANLPFYAVKTVLRMFIALIISLIFTLIFGTLAAKSQRAERVIVPSIDILQSVPVLSFLSITYAGSALHSDVRLHFRNIYGSGVEHHFWLLSIVKNGSL